jgi:hypothetical protein
MDRFLLLGGICCCCGGGSEEDLLITVRSTPVFDISLSNTSDSCIAFDTSFVSSDDKF